MTMSRSRKSHNKSRNPTVLKTHDDASRRTLAAAIAIVIVCALAYANTLNVPFIFDDSTVIHENPTIKQLWPPWQALSPPHTGAPVDGRPILNLSFAVNYATGALSPRGYHLVNLTIHILAALLLFGVVRRTLADRLAATGTAAKQLVSAGPAGTPLAAAVALIWAVHPLQTESVTYISQRAESLVSLFYLLTLYCAIRGADSTHSNAWSAAAVASCTLGMASKEVMVSAPLIVLLYDRIFLAGSFRDALRKRWAMYVGLASTWILLALLVIQSKGRAGSAGFGLEIGPWEYALTQCRAIPHYLRLCFWPSGLCLDYGESVVQSLGAVWPQALGIAAFVLLTLVALRRWPVAGLLGAFFLAVLAPTSSIVPVVTQTMAEHRMYLPLAAVVTGTVAGAWLAGQWLVRRGTLSPPALKSLGGFLAIGLIGALAITTFHRNGDYRDEISIWEDVIDKIPENGRARSNLGEVLSGLGRHDEAIAHCEKAVELEPNSAKVLNDLGATLAGAGRFDEAIVRYQKALQIKPNFARAHNNLGLALVGRGQIDDALLHYQKALALDRGYADAYYNLANALLQQGKPAEAIERYRDALNIRPDFAKAHANLGAALAQTGQYDAAIAQFQKALEIQPQNAKTRENLDYVRTLKAKTAKP
jgi:protein O-mannosyl-transferase